MEVELTGRFEQLGRHPVHRGPGQLELERHHRHHQGRPVRVLQGGRLGLPRRAGRRSSFRLFPAEQSADPARRLQEDGSEDSSEEGSSFNASSDGGSSEEGSDFEDASESGSDFGDEEEDSEDDWDAQVSPRALSVAGRHPLTPFVGAQEKKLEKRGGSDDGGQSDDSGATKKKSSSKDKKGSSSKDKKRR